MGRLNRIITLLFAVVLLAAGDVASAQSRSSKKIRQQQRRNEQQIKETNRLLKENAAAIESRLNQLSLLDGQIDEYAGRIRQLRHTVDSIRRIERVTGDSVKALDNRYNLLCDKYAKALRNMQRHKSAMGDMAFLFSSETFVQAYRRYRSLQQFSRWRQRKADEIVELRDELELRRTELERLRKVSSSALAALDNERKSLRSAQSETEAIVAKLKKENKNLKKVMERRRREAEALDKELDRVIAEEMRRQQEEQARLEEEKRKKEEEEARRRQKEGTDKTKKDDKLVQAPEASSGGGNSSGSNMTKQQSADGNKPVSPQLTGSFESNKGKLPFPVDGSYTIVKKFGRQQHPKLPKVVTNNSGIDVETASGAAVKVVFDGEISQIFKLNGYNNVVVVRHGEYVTVYANLAGLEVHKGDKVKTGQVIGHVYADASDGNRSVLHFEVRRETEKRNPEEWLKGK